MAAALAVHRMWTQAGSLVLVASPSERQSFELARKAGVFLGMLGVRVRGVKDIVLGNGSRMVALPGTEATIRGFSGASLVLIDEAARVKDDVYRALRPMLAVKNGDLWLMSTPRGKVGFFYEAWAFGGERWTRVSVPATECGRIRGDFLDEERDALGADWFAQEYMCEFLGGVGVWFSRGVVEGALGDGKPLF